MKKIPTVFKRDPEDMSRVTNEVHPDCQWVLDGEGVATRKYDGTCVYLDSEGNWWARREVKRGKPRPDGYVSLEYDENTGKTVGWEPVEQSPFAKFHAEALAFLPSQDDWPAHSGTYELVGPKINGDPERLGQHVLLKHAEAERASIPFARPYSPLMIAEAVKALGEKGWEGIVWHHPDGRMAKLKARDYK